MKKITLFLVALLSIMTMNAATETVYFVNANNWTGTIKAHLWGGTVAETSWPGVEMTKESEQIAGFDVYSYSAEAGAYANVIFNNGSAQTADLTWTAGKYYVKDGWYTKDEAVVKLGQPIEYETVYFVDAYKWGSVNIYTWTPEVGTWPGKAMTKESEQIAGYDVYSYTVEKGTSFGGLNFNCKGDNSKKTGDLKWTAGKYYVKDAWYTKEEAEKGLVPSVKLAGTLSSWDGTAMELSDDYKTASLTLTLAVGEYELKIIEDGAWLGNEGTMERGNSSDWTFVDANNCKIVVDVAGEYVFTWTLETNKLTVTYPAIPAVPTIVEGTKLYLKSYLGVASSSSYEYKVVFGEFTVPSSGGGLNPGGTIRPLAETATATEVAMTTVYTKEGKYNIWEVVAPTGTSDSIFTVIISRRGAVTGYITPLKYDGEHNLFQLPDGFSFPRNTNVVNETAGEWGVYVEGVDPDPDPELVGNITAGLQFYFDFSANETWNALTGLKVKFTNSNEGTETVEMTQLENSTIWNVVVPEGLWQSFEVGTFKIMAPSIKDLEYDGTNNLYTLDAEGNGTWSIYAPAPVITATWSIEEGATIESLGNISVTFDGVEKAATTQTVPVCFYAVDENNVETPVTGLATAGAISVSSTNATITFDASSYGNLAEGKYRIRLAVGDVYFNGDKANVSTEEYVLTFNYVLPVEPTFTVSPENHSIVKEFKEIVITYPELEMIGVKPFVGEPDLTWPFFNQTLVNENGKVTAEQAMAPMVWEQVAANAVKISLSTNYGFASVTTAGTYSVTIPAGLIIFPTNKSNRAFTLYYTVDPNLTDVDNATLSTIFVQDGRIVAEGEYQIYTITGQNVTGMNGSLENGVYVVKSANAAVKVIVK